MRFKAKQKWKKKNKQLSLKRHESDANIKRVGRIQERKILQRKSDKKKKTKKKQERGFERWHL